MVFTLLLDISSVLPCPFQLLEYLMGGRNLYLILKGNWYLPTRAEGNTPLRVGPLTPMGKGRKPLAPTIGNRHGPALTS